MLSFAVHPPAARATVRGFSLVEAALAIALVAFAFVAIFALVPAGLGIFREGLDASVSAQLAQRVLSDVQAADLATLTSGAQGAGDPAAPFVILQPRYFDDQGNEIAAGADPARILYQVRVRLSKPGARDPAAHTATAFSALPSTGAPFNPRFLHLVTVQIVANPGGRSLHAGLDAESQLYTQRRFDRAGLRVSWQSYSTALARLAAPAVKTP